jgi:hypothetical protein
MEIKINDDRSHQLSNLETAIEVISANGETIRIISEKEGFTVMYKTSTDNHFKDIELKNGIVKELEEDKNKEQE